MLMLILSTSGWPDYELIDTGHGQRLERFGPYTLARPDPQIIWKPHLSEDIWQQIDAAYTRTSSTQGKWIIKDQMPEKWLIHYQNLAFYCKLTPFKHTGVFPEQSLHWDWMSQIINSCNISLNILNLFGYTGLASLAVAQAGARVTHLDASYQAIGWARENQQASNLTEKPIRWILDDALKFCRREVKRDIKYDGIIMDPPVYGHGPHGEKWDFNESFPQLMEICQKLLSKNSSFFLVNAYAVSTSALTLENVLKDYLASLGGKFEAGELALEEKDKGRLLSTGIFARWSR